MSELKTCFKRVDYDLAGLLHYMISATSACQRRHLMADIIRRGFRELEVA